MNLGQRVVLVVATFFGFGLAAQAVDAARTADATDGGWFNYAPNSGVVFSPSNAMPWWEHALPYAIALVLWTALAFWLVRARPEPAEA
jgi:hypothetical protein